MSLCRHYVRELRRSVLVETPEPEKLGGRESSESHTANRNQSGAGRPSNGASRYDGNDDIQDEPQRLSAFLRSEGRSARNSNESGDSIRRASDDGPGPGVANQEERRNDNSPGHTVARSDIRASAVRILYTYLLSGSDREVILPETIVNDIVHMVEEDGRDDPEVFDTAKDYVFQAMERDAFPGFLQAKALGNMVPLSILIRLILALVSLGGAFWAAFYVVLSDQPRHVRCWVSIYYSHTLRFSAGLL